MLTKEQNDRLTRVGPEPPAGELLRRYWHPVSIAAELTDEAPTKCVRVLGEDLVLFRDKEGNVGNGVRSTRVVDVATGAAGRAGVA